MKKLLLISTAVFALTAANGQTTFQKTYGGIANDNIFFIQQTNDSGYILSGTTSSFGIGNKDVYLIKTNAYGDTLWTKTFGGTDDDWGMTVQQTNDGGYIIAGEIWSFGAGNADAFLIKTNGVGNLLWTKTFGGTGDDNARSVQQTNDGGYIIVGYTKSFGIGNADVYLVKTDGSGDTLWTKTFGGIGNEWGYAVQQTTDSGYIITGWTGSFGAGGTDVYVIKIDSIGSLLWTKTFGGTGFEDGWSIQQTNDGGYIIGSITDSFGNGNRDFYLIKIDNIGNLIWTKTFGGTLNDIAFSVVQTNDGGYAITGMTESFGTGYDLYLIKTDFSGNIIWAKTFGGAGYEEVGYVQQTNDGGYIIAGNTNGFGAGNMDIYLIKTDNIGNSECNEINPATITSSPVTQVSNPITLFSSGGTITTPTFLVSSGGITNTLCTSVGINETQMEEDINFFPNPFSTQTVLQTDKLLHNATLTVHNCFGQTVAQIKNISGQTITFNRGNLPSGLYFIRITQDSKVIASGKLVITD